MTLNIIWNNRVVRPLIRGLALTVFAILSLMTNVLANDAKAAAPSLATPLERLYFIYDRLSVPATEMPKLQRTAAHLKRNPAIRVEIQGHTDERGSDEYNLMISESMAQAVKAALVDLGVSAHQLRTASNGEEQPLDPGHDPAAWDKNRRVEFRIIE
jgi:peptidoglycan-associated lipoprotein